MDTGMILYLISLATMTGLYAILTLGLNLQWGFAGMFNAGIAGFFAIGAYATSILTTPPAEDRFRASGREVKHRRQIGIESQHLQSRTDQVPQTLD